MRNLKDHNATWNRNQRVSGSYLGIAYKGELDESTPYGCRMGPHGTFIFVVNLAETINVYGEVRHRISIWASDENTIFADGPVALGSSVVDVANIQEYGLTQKLSNSIRCF